MKQCVCSVICLLALSAPAYSQTPVIDLTREVEEVTTLGIPGYSWGATPEGSTEPVVPWTVDLEVVALSPDERGPMLTTRFTNKGKVEAVIPVSMKMSQVYKDGMKERYSLTLVLVPALPQSGGAEQVLRATYGSVSSSVSLYRLAPGQSVILKLRTWPLKAKQGEKWKLRASLTRLFDDRYEEAARAKPIESPGFTIQE